MVKNKLKTEYNSDDAETWRDLTLKQQARKFLGKKFKPTHDFCTDIPTPTLTVKEEFSLLDITPFTLGVKPDLDNLSLEYDLKDAKVSVKGYDGIGLATIYDYSIVLFMTSHLAKEMNRIKRFVQMSKDGKNGDTVNPKLPPRTFSPDVKDILEFCNRQGSGQQYESVHKALKRLKSTTIFIEEKIEAGSGKKIRRSGSFSFISDFRISACSESGNVLSVEIDIPNWIYDGIVRADNPTVLTLNSSFFEIPDGITRVLYRAARRFARHGTPYEMSVDEFYTRSGSRRVQKYFKRDLKKKIEELKQPLLGEFFVEYIKKGRGKQYIKFTPVKKETEIISLPLTEDLQHEAEKAAPGYDIARLHQLWLAFCDKHEPPQNPRKAFLGYCKKYHERKPLVSSDT